MSKLKLTKRFSYILLVPLLCTLATYAFFIVSHVVYGQFAYSEIFLQSVKGLNINEIYKHWKQEVILKSVRVGGITLIATTIIGVFDIIWFKKR